MTKTSKSAVSGGEKNKNGKKKKNANGPNTKAMKQQAPKPNPFESIWSRRKFDILGKKRKGEERRLGQARSRAIDKRKTTLLKEYEQKGKSSLFVDKRIGEQNDDLGEFDKAILRSQREHRMKLSKKSKYNLSDGEEDDFEGFGALSGRDDFEDEMLPDEDADGFETAEFGKKSAASQQKFLERGDNEEEENKHKTKKEVMEEIILKSKYFKAQKAKDKEENEQLMEELDNNFSSLVQSKALLSLTEPGKMNALKALLNKNIPNENTKDESSDVQSLQTSNQDKPDSYDKLVKAMSLEMRARPSDRTKTAEEIAQEERERLERLEEERQKRMLATDDISDEENEDAEKSSSQRPRSISGDDLGDSFLLDEEPRTKRGWVDEILERRDAEGESGGDGSSENSESAEGESEDKSDDKESDEDNYKEDLSMKDWEQSDDDNLETDLGAEDEDIEESDEDADADADENDMGQRESKKKQNIDAVENSKRLKSSSDSKKVNADGKLTLVRSELPYLIEAPKTLEELHALLDNCSNADIILIINRIRASNAIKLAAENRKKMQVFYGVLLQYFAVLANKKPLNIELLDLLVKPLMEMSTEIPYFAAICARQRILRTRMQMCEIVNNQEISCWPSTKTLFLLRLWSLIFPCSDFRHAVMTPAILLMCEYLMRCPIVSGRDIAVGSFLCSMILSITKQSQKFCPEAIIFLRMMLMAAKEEGKMSNHDSQFYHLMELKTLRPLLYLHECVNEIAPLNFLKIMDLQEDSSFFCSDNLRHSPFFMSWPEQELCKVMAGYKASVLMTLAETLKGYVDVYGRLSSFPEIFLPISALLLEVAEQENFQGALQDKFKDIAQLIKTKVDEHHMSRLPLQMWKQKPVPIKMLTPKFEENFVKGRDYDPDRERAEMRKLKKRLKEERKGAVRELRKDNHFLYEAKAKDKAQMEAERAEKFSQVRHFLEEQEHAFRSGQLGKGRKRRR